MQKQQKKRYIFSQIFKKFTSPANEFPLHKCKNKNGKMNFFLFFSNLKKCTSPANELLFHKCRNKKKINSFLSNLKKSTSPASDFPLYKLRNNRKTKKRTSPLKSENAQVQPMRFYYKMQKQQENEKMIEFSFKSEKITSPANEFLLHS